LSAPDALSAPRSLAPCWRARMSSLRKQTRLLRAELVERRAAVTAGWSELEAKGESVQQAELAITAELKTSHKERLEQLARELRREEDEANRLEVANAALQAGVAADLRSLLELLRLPFDSTSGAVSTGFARVKRIDENKRVLRERLARQVETTQALLEEAEEQAARAEAAARVEREREQRLARGDRMFLFDPKQRSLTPCEVQVVRSASLSGGTLRCTTRGGIVSVQLAGASVAPAYAAPTAEPPPAQAWLHFVVRPDASASSQRAAETAAGGAGPPVQEAVHLVANRREHATTWLLGLQALARRATQQAAAQQAAVAADEEADGGEATKRASEAAREAHARDWRLGALLWLIARLVVGEAARKQNKSPGTVLVEALRRAAADRAQAAAELKAELKAEAQAEAQAKEQAKEEAARSPGAHGQSSAVSQSVTTTPLPMEHGSASSRNCDVATQALRLTI
jgi:hypothetical protein